MSDIRQLDMADDSKGDVKSDRTEMGVVRRKCGFTLKGRKMSAELLKPVSLVITKGKALFTPVSLVITKGKALFTPSVSRRGATTSLLASNV